MASVIVFCGVCGSGLQSGNCGRVCEPCRDFFRCFSKYTNAVGRCSKTKQCNIQPSSFNNCKYCRFLKCLYAGLRIRDFIPFRIMDNICKPFIYDCKLADAIVQAQMDTCPFNNANIMDLVRWAGTPPFRYATTLFCPLNLDPDHTARDENYYDIGRKFAGCGGVIQFAKRIPGFKGLSEDDQDTLIKGRLFPVLLVRLARLLKTRGDFIYCLNGQFMSKDSKNLLKKAPYLAYLFEITEKINDLNLSDYEIAIFSAYLLVNIDTLKLRKDPSGNFFGIQHKLLTLLYHSMSENHPETPLIFYNLLDLFSHLIQLDFLHDSNTKFRNLLPQKQNHGTVQVIPYPPSLEEVSLFTDVYHNDSSRVLENLMWTAESKRYYAMGEPLTCYPILSSRYLQDFSLDETFNERSDDLLEDGSITFTESFIEGPHIQTFSMCR